MAGWSRRTTLGSMLVARLTVLSTLVVTLFAAVAPPAAATVLEARTLQELIARADRVDVGVVQSRHALPLVDDLGLTETRVRVERTLLGTPRAQLTVTQLGGERNGTATELVGDARLMPGTRFLLLTWLAPDGRRYLVSMGMGAFVVDGSRITQEVDAAIQLPDGVLQPAPFRRAMRLVDVEQAVRARVAP